MFQQLAISLVLLTFISVSQSDRTVVVTTRNGPIKGRVIAVEGQHVSVFTAIHYAHAPKVTKRFKPSEPIGKWKGTYDATHLGKVCYQTREFPGPPVLESEDCLVVNVWSNGLSGKKPVMLFIHGGGFATGWSNEALWPTYNGSILATFGVVVVTMNYRLGNLGFTYDGTDKAPGNAAFHDQLLAMKWVQDNIENFGGDPDQVTLFGESAGSMSVSFHLTSPLSKGLFKRAIMQSGSAYHYRGRLLNPSLHKDISHKMAGKLGCKLNWLNCAKMINPSLVMSALPIAVPVAGDKFNPKGPMAAMRSGEWNKDVELLNGVTDDEGAMFVEPIVTKETVTKKNIKKLLEKVMGHSMYNMLQYNIEGPTAQQIEDYYFGKLTESDWKNQNLLKKLLGEVWGDGILYCPNYFQIEDYNKQNKTRPYLYQMSYRSKTASKLICRKPWQGTCHMYDLPMVFGQPIRQPKVFDADDYQVSLLFNWYWTNFAKTGNPVSGTPPAKLKIRGVEKYPNVSWPTFDALKKKNQVMLLNPISIQTIDDPWAKKCNEFWRKYF